VANDEPGIADRVQRVLAYMVASSIGLSLIAFFTVVIATATGVRDFTTGVWPIVIVLPMVGLPIGFLLIIVVLVMTFIRRSRDAKDARS
jgi:hypothetical protein